MEEDEAQEDVKPPLRLIDEIKDGPDLPKSKPGKKNGPNGAGLATPQAEEFDVGELLDDVLGPDSEP